MRRKSQGQSMVEMALLLPLLLVVVFGIIDFGYLIYGYGSIYNAARNASEIASGAPPFQSRLDTGPDYNEDSCISSILDAATDPAGFFPDLRDNVTIRYPEYVQDPYAESPGTFLDEEDRRQIGYPIEVTIEYRIKPLTPLWQLIPGIWDEQGVLVKTTARRSIEGYGRDPTAENLSPCDP